MYGVFSNISHVYIYMNEANVGIYIYMPYTDAMGNACFSEQFDFDDHASVS